jgi:hypothetical protein
MLADLGLSSLHWILKRVNKAHPDRIRCADEYLANEKLYPWDVERGWGAGRQASYAERARILWSAKPRRNRFGASKPSSQQSGHDHRARTSNKVFQAHEIGRSLTWLSIHRIYSCQPEKALLKFAMIFFWCRLTSAARDVRLFQIWLARPSLIQSRAFLSSFPRVYDQYLADYWISLLHILSSIQAIWCASGGKGELNSPYSKLRIQRLRRRAFAFNISPYLFGRYGINHNRLCLDSTSGSRTENFVLRWTRPAGGWPLFQQRSPRAETCHADFTVNLCLNAHRANLRLCQKVLSAPRCHMYFLLRVPPYVRTASPLQFTNTKIDPPVTTHAALWRQSGINNWDDHWYSNRRLTILKIQAELSLHLHSFQNTRDFAQRAIIGRSASLLPKRASKLGFIEIFSWYWWIPHRASAFCPSTFQ